MARALHSDKKVKFLFTFQVEEQCGPLNALNRSQVIFALNQTLLQAENVRLGLAKPTFSTDELIRLYRTGELDAFYFKQVWMVDLTGFPNFHLQSYLLYYRQQENYEALLW